ncbi:MAG TPA: CBS domain-containing protein [Longimicrobiales bacterium]|nr:CBS domain-containing protein [Longimicrobiales bacterium]
MTRVREIMTSDVSTISPDMTLRDALEVLRGRNVAGAPVARGSRVVGVLSTADLLDVEVTTPPLPRFRPQQAVWGEAWEEEEWQEGASPPVYFVDLWRESESDAAERMSTLEGPEWDFLADHTVGEIMSRTLLSVGPDEDVRLAAQRMSEAGVHRLLVLEGGRLLGVVSASDIVRAVAGGLI